MTAVAEKRARLWVRDELDFYVEPERVTDELLAKESFFGRVVDPCCGSGNILRAMRRHGVAAFGSDIVERGANLDEGWLGAIDFLAEHWRLGRVDNLVFNPPFFRAKGAEAFIRRAHALATRKVCAFVDIRFLAGGARARGLWTDLKPHRVWICSDRPSCPPGAALAEGQVAGGGTADWCWLVWDRAAPAYPTQLGWLTRRDAA